MGQIVKVNVMKMYIIKILKKLHFNNAIYRILRRSKGKVIKSNSIEKEREMLNKVSKKPCGSAYVKNEILEKKVDLQIIVPCYNVEKYVEECLDSILNQETKYTYKVIVVDDGSTDKTSQIVDKYSRYPQFEIIHQKNKGFSGARNTALAKICGRFIMFVDSDDKIPQGTIQELLKRAYESGADIVEGSYLIFNDIRVKEKIINKDLDNVDPCTSLRGLPWGKVIKSELFSNIVFPEGFWYEDTIMAFLVFPLVKSASTLEKIVYHYRRNKEGISATSRRKIKSLDTYWILEQMLAEQKKMGIEKNQKVYEQVIHQIYINFVRTYNFDNSVKKSIFILSSYILNTEFSKYKTKKFEFKDLEEALRSNNYTLYSHFCALKQF